MRLFSKAIALLMMLIALPAHAEWNKSFEVEYLMGDGDNRTSARQAALEQIKLKASGEAGTYVHSTTTLHENGDLTENIQMLGASMVKIGKSEERMSVNPSGQAVLWVRAMTSLDETELVRRVQVLQQDKEKTRQVKLLQSENDALRHDLDKIRKGLAMKSDPSRTAELLVRQDVTIGRMVENGRTLSRVFERGTLLQMASHNTDAFEDAKRDLNEQFFTPLMQTPITAEIESVEASGNEYVALVRVGWGVDATHLRPVLARYLKVGDSRSAPNIRLYAFENLNSRGPSVLSERVYQYLAKKGVDLKLSLAGKEVRLPMFYRDNAFMDACERFSHARAGEAKYLCLMSQNKNDSDVRGSSSQTSNPIRIRLTRAEADRATSVDASWVSTNNEPF